MGFEYASIKLLFPDSPSRLHLFLERSLCCCVCVCVRVRVYECCSFCRIRLYFQDKGLPVIAPKPPPASERDLRIVAVGSRGFWNSSLPELGSRPAGCQDDVESSAEISGEQSEKLLLIVFCRLKCLESVRFDASRLFVLVWMFGFYSGRLQTSGTGYLDLFISIPNNILMNMLIS